MKTLLLFIAITSIAVAADLKLTDGRTFRDYRISGETPTTVMIRHAGGAVKVDKSKLPAEVLAQHPIDTAAAAAEAEETAKGKAVYEAQARAVAEKKARDHEEFLAEVARKREADAARQAASPQSRPAKSAAEKKTVVTRSETRMNTPGSYASETVSLTLPPEAKRQVYVVEYEVEGGALALDLRVGENSQHSQLSNVSSKERWLRRVDAKTGDRLYLWAKAGASGGEEFRVRIKVDNRIVKEAVAKGSHVAAEISYTLP